MRKGKIFTNCISIIFTLIAITSFASCSTDESSSIIDERVPLETDIPFSVVLKAHSENQDISAKDLIGNTTLLIFDQNNDFYNQITIDRKYVQEGKPIEIKCPESSQITIVAWAGLNSDESQKFSRLNNADIISDLQDCIKQNKSAGNTLPVDLFYGQATINRTTKADTQELIIERKINE